MTLHRSIGSTRYHSESGNIALCVGMDLMRGIGAVGAASAANFADRFAPTNNTAPHIR